MDKTNHSESSCHKRCPQSRFQLHCVQTQLHHRDHSIPQCSCRLVRVCIDQVLHHTPQQLWPSKRAFHTSREHCHSDLCCCIIWNCIQQWVLFLFSPFLSYIFYYVSKIELHACHYKIHENHCRKFSLVSKGTDYSSITLFNMFSHDFQQKKVLFDFLAIDKKKNKTR